jgi:hypothetical protein
VYALALAAICLLAAARGRGPQPWHVAWTLALEAGLVVLAAAATIAVVRGDGPERSGLSLGYLLTAVLVLPAILHYARRGGTRWDSLILGITAFVVGVIAVRIGMTWSEGGV